MIVTRATMTGADESVKPRELLELAREFPFVEFGILVSQTKTGEHSRYPSNLWMRDLYKVASNNPMNLSLHVCGALSRDLLKGSVTIIGEMGYLLPMFTRMQLNFNSQYCDMDFDMMIHAMCDVNKMFLFQVNDNNKSDLVLKVREAGLNAFPLFDASGGKGVSPKEWPEILKDPENGLPLYCGYAGGLGPDNIMSELVKINNTVNDELAEIWVDMEQAIRSNNDEKFDLEKVVAVLKEIQDYTRYAK